PKGVMEKVEPILQRIQFEGEFEKESDKIIGSLESYQLWRELSYLILGRAYYELNDNEKAAYYLLGVPEGSPFRIVSEIEKSWTYIRTGRINDAIQLLEQLASNSSLSV